MTRLQNSYREGDTIAAVATARLPAGVAVIRLSGPDAWRIGRQILPALAQASPRHMVWGHAVNDAGEVLDDALGVGFVGPASFTGEDVVELHTHGGPAVVSAVLQACLAAGARQALPGEFTRRAVLNGKMDLTAAEGLADLIAADTEAQRKQALRQLNGALGERFESWRRQVLMLLAQVEAAIDFPDEELEVLAAPELAAGMRTLLDQWSHALADEAGRRVRDGVNMAIVGAPNAGKSTLLNALAGRAVAIVSPTAGTTRDVVSRWLDIGGYPVEVADTAGLRATADAIEAEGVRRARAAALAADLCVVVVDGREEEALRQSSRGVKAMLGRRPAVPDWRDALGDFLKPGCGVVVFSHADVLAMDLPSKVTVGDADYPALALNLTDDRVLARLLPLLGRLVASVAAGATDAAHLTRARHRDAVADASRMVGQALMLLGRADGEGTVAELVAHELREAAAAIGTVTGRTGTEDVLDVVFSTFCVGK